MPPLRSWSAQNPLRVASQSFSSSQVRLGSANYAASSGSSTDTVNYTTVNSETLSLGFSDATLLVPLYLTVKHSVDNALFDVAVRMYTDSTATTTLATERMRNITLPKADQYFAVAFTAMFDLAFLSTPPLPTFSPGQHLIRILIGPTTAGTLTWGEGNSTDAYGFVLIAQSGLVVE